MSQEIMMPVIALNEKCLNCPELDITIDKTVFYAGLEKHSANRMFCRNHYICTHAYNEGAGKKAEDIRGPLD